MEMQELFESLDHFDFDIPDDNGETPLFYAICQKRLDLVKYFVSKGADVSRKTYKRKYDVVYSAATKGNVETL